MRTRSFVLFGLLGLAAFPASATAQQEGEFSVQRFEPAIGANNFLSVERVRMATQWGWTAGLMFNYARDPLVIVSCRAETNCDEPNAQNVNDVAVVSDLFTWDLMGSLNLLPFLQVGLRLPLVFVNGQGLDVETGGPLQPDGLSGFGVGDPNVEGKIRFFGDSNDLVNLGAAVNVGFPLGHATAEQKYIGNDSPVTVSGRGIFDLEVSGFSVGANLIATYRGDNTLGTTSVGPMEFRYGVGAGYAFSPVFKIMAEGFGSTQFSSTNGTNVLEVDAGVQFTPLSSGLVITAGGGTGVLQGVGSPLVRGIVGLMWSAESGDADGDGIGDDEDQCKTIAEDIDGFEDGDGCPEDDNDKDGIPDVKDQCKDKPETVNGYKDDDGCPDTVADTDKDGIPDTADKCPELAGQLRTAEFYGCPDTDGDGVADPKDQCPTEKEDTDGFNDTDGCPDPDNDNDGVLDDRDECPEELEVKNGFKDEDGCPDEVPDSDKDGIPDSLDKCPNAPETLNGFEDEDGCPDRGVKLVDVTKDDIKILQRVEFETGSDKIKGNTSFTVLDAVASAVKNNPQIFVIEVAGHTDNAGDAKLNKDLSQKRADAVKTYLVGKGVETHRLRAVGYGADKPIAENTTAAGKQKNRRVEFNIVHSTSKKLEPAPAPAAPAPAAPASPAPAAPAPAAPASPAPAAPAPAAPPAPPKP